MSKIDTQIKELQTKKCKIDYLLYIKSLLTDDKSCVDYIEVKEEVLKLVIPQLDALVKSIEDDVTIDLENPVKFSSEETEVLKTVAAKVLSKGPIPSNPTPMPSSGTPVKKAEYPAPPKRNDPFSNVENNAQTQEWDINAKMSFAMDNRHLANKKVRTNDSQEGVIVGLDAPNVIVQLNSGTRVKYLLQNVTQL